MDVLSEVLRMVKLEGALFFNAEFSAPWCVHTAESHALAPHLSPGAERLIIYHFLTEGRAWARLPGGPHERLSAGDIVVVPHGDEHLLGNGVPERPVDSMQTFGGYLAEGLKPARFGGGGEITRFVCGYLACEPRLCEMFLCGLPKILKVRVAGDTPGQWVEHAIRFAVNEASGCAGGGIVVAKLSEVLFVETLRQYISALPPDETGWLAGARDPAVGQALALLHKEPAEPWTLEDLARRAGLSRTRLAERFRHFLGVPPMQYLAQWRLKLGAEMLESSQETVAEIAAAVGYGSEAAFNRAFKREFARPPARFRRKAQAAGGER